MSPSLSSTKIRTVHRGPCHPVGTAPAGRKGWEEGPLRAQGLLGRGAGSNCRDAVGVQDPQGGLALESERWRAYCSSRLQFKSPWRVQAFTATRSSQEGCSLKTTSPGSACVCVVFKTLFI